MKIAFVSGKPSDMPDTLLPAKSKPIWQEVCRVLDEELSDPLFKRCTFLIPIWSKFDLRALYMAEKLGIKVEYYVPSETWGLDGVLPKHQERLVERMAYPRHVIPGHRERMVQMIRDADLVYLLPKNLGVADFLSAMTDKNIRIFPMKNMRYCTELEYQTYKLRMDYETHVSYLQMSVLAGAAAPVSDDIPQAEGPAGRLVFSDDVFDNETEETPEQPFLSTFDIDEEDLPFPTGLLGPFDEGELPF